MPHAISQFLAAAISIFAIVNPVGNLPVFVAMTEGLPARQRRRLFRLAGVVALCVMCVMALVGQLLMANVFHINIHEFSFGGGLLLVVVGIRNILAGMGRRRDIDLTACDDRTHALNLAVTPLAVPLLAGPGSIVTVMLLVNVHGAIYALAATGAAFAVVFLILQWSGQAMRLMGTIGTIAVGRVMQIFIVAIGVHFMFRAVIASFPALAP